MNLSAVNGLTPAAHTRAAHLSGGALRMAGPAEQRAAVGAQFEAILVRQLLGKTMTKMLDSGDSAAGSVYGDMLTETLANQLTSGPGLGLGRIIEQQLTPRGIPVATPDISAAGSTQAHP